MTLSSMFATHQHVPALLFESQQQVAFGLMLASIPVVPLLPPFKWSASIYFALMAVWAMYVGSHRSLERKPVRAVSFKQSLAVPLACSASLFSFYCLLRFFPDLDLRTFVRAYLSLVGALAVGGNLADPIGGLWPTLRADSASFDLPEWLAKEEGKPVHVTATNAEIIAAVAGVAVAGATLLPQAPFTLSNFVAACLATELLQLLSLGSFGTAAAMLSGLLLYDVFWVFGSSHIVGDNVMLTVATSQAFDGPMKFIYPQWNLEAANAYSLLGLGDVAVPGLLLALMLRFDRSRSRSGSLSGSLSGPDSGSGSPGGEGAPPMSEDKAYFQAGLVSYLAGFALTIGANASSGAAQPALLYLVPALLGGVLLQAFARSESGLLLAWKDEPALSEAIPVEVEEQASK
eukprot:jgi/Mesen1/6069/ME000031S05346